MTSTEQALCTLVFALSLAPSAVQGQTEAIALFLHARGSNGETSFFQGTPIPVTVSLVNMAVRHRQAQEKERYWNEVERQAGATGLPTATAVNLPPASPITLSKDNIGWLSSIHFEFSASAPGERGFLPSISWPDMRIIPEAVLEGPAILNDDPVWATMEIPPSVTANLAPGEYRLKATFPNASADSLQFTIRKASTAVELAQLEFELGEYALRHRQFGGAIEHATRAIGIFPAGSGMAYLTLGDAYSALGDLRNAVDAYEKFLQRYEGSKVWEYPAKVRAMVTELRRRMEPRKETAK